MISVDRQISFTSECSLVITTFDGRAYLVLLLGPLMHWVAHRDSKVLQVAGEVPARWIHQIPRRAALCSIGLSRV